MKAIFQNEEIGGPVYDGFTFGGYALTTPLVKADYPGLRAIRLGDGTVILAEDLPDSYVIPPGGGGSGGPHTHDWADVTGEPSTFPPTSHDTDHDDRFSQLAHTHAAHADTDHDDRFALIAQGVPVGGALGQVLAKASATNYDTMWQSASAPAPQALDWLTDVATAGQAATNVLTYNGSAWVPAAVPGPQGTLGFAQKTTNQTGISAITDLTGLSVTVTVGAGRRIKVTGKGNVSQATATGTVRGTIREGTTLLNDWLWADLLALGDLQALGEAILTPTAGSHTYKLSLQTSAGTVGLEASTDRPAFILVEDIGT